MKPTNKKYTFQDLVDIVTRLRAPGGCPWDREQTHASIKKNLVEEAYELAEAIDSGVAEKMADESGDLLLQVVFNAVIAKDNGEYEIDDVSDAICRKLIHRHPHVFGSVSVSGSEEVLANWDAIKRNDRAQQSIAAEMKGISAYLPALLRAEKIQKKAEKAGFQIAEKAELMHCAEGADDTEKLANLLFDTVKLCRARGLEPELLLADKLQRFIDEFDLYEKQKEAKLCD